MPRPGSRQSAVRFSVKGWPALMLLILAAAPANNRPSDDRMDAPLTGQPGDPENGRRVVLDRALSACLLCHAGPFPAPHLQGTIGPNLDGVGNRLDAAQIRLRLVDPARANPDSVMPGYYVTEGRNRVGQPWRGKTILTAAQIEDVVAYLTGLR